MKVFVITDTYSQYRDFLRQWKVSERDFIWLDRPDKIVGHRRFLFVEYGMLPERYVDLLGRYIIPYEGIRIRMEQANTPNAIRGEGR